MTMTERKTPVVDLGQIPRYFGGGKNVLGSKADMDFRHALLALQALTGRREDDPAMRYIVADLCEAVSDLCAESANYVSIIGNDGIDNMDDERFMEVTGETVPYEKVHLCPAPEHWGKLPGSSGLLEYE